jgi:nucleotide-binding universal stress UspA family protein
MKCDQIMIERTAASVVRSPIKPTAIKTILFHVHNDDQLQDRLQVALTLCRAFGAHLHLLHVVPLQAYTVVDAFGTFVSSQIVEVLENEADKLRGLIEAELANEDVSWDYEEITGELMPHLIQCAALADLVVIGRESPSPEFAGPSITLLGDLLHRMRTPLLVIGDGTKDLDPFGLGIVAWNGSYEAANALRNAVPMLKLASEVRVLRIEEAKAGQFPSTRALEYLSRHGIHADLVTEERVSDSIKEDLVEYASFHRAGLIVMGGYGHSRAGEFLFGGVTRGVLRACPVSLLMSR